MNIILRRGEVGGMGERIMALIADYIKVLGNICEEIWVGLRSCGGWYVRRPKGREVNRFNAEFKCIRRLISEEPRCRRTCITICSRGTVPAQQITISGTFSQEINTRLASPSTVKSATAKVTLCSEVTHALYHQLITLEDNTRTLTFSTAISSFDWVRETRMILAPFLAR